MPTPTFEQKLLDYLTVTSAATVKAAQLYDAEQRRSAEANELIPKVADALVAHGRIAPEEREKVAKALQNPNESLRLLIKLAAHRNAQELDSLRLGTPAGGAQKQASELQRDFYGGADPKSPERESNQVWARHFGLASNGHPA